MSKQRIVIDCGSLSADGFKSVCDLAPGQLPALQNLANYLQSVPDQSAAVLSINVGMSTASGSFAFASVIATDVLAINGVSFTCVASGAGANEFNVGLDDAATAINAAAAINASATALAQQVVAVAVDESVVITSKQPGVVGNAITISTPDSTITPSGARLTGGADGTAYTLDFA